MLARTHQARPWILIALLASLCQCSSEPAIKRVLVLGFDGLDPQTVDLLMSEGKLPNFAKLRQDGAYGRLLSQKPILSPVVWTTIATGKTPAQHGIGHFVAVNEKTGQQLPVTSQMRKVKAIWDIFSEAGRQVGVVGWWATWPAEHVRGTIVSDHACYHFLFEDGFAPKGESTGRISPPEQEAEIDAMIRRPSDLTASELDPFVKVPPDELSRPFDFNDELSHFRWALATAQSYERIGLHLLESQKPDLLLVYFEGTDSVAHLFGHLFRAQPLAGELAEQQKRYGSAVEAMYLYADQVLGRFLERLDSSTTLVVLSDHGFELGALPEDPSKLRDMRRVSEKFHRIEGVLYLYGRGVKPHSFLDRPSILDVTPTILALAGLDAAKDMPGRVLSEALDIGPVSTRASYESGSTAQVAEMAEDTNVDPAILERLKSLGYLDASSPQGERNLAAVRFEEGRYQEAEQAYRELVRKEPEDGALRASLAGSLGALGRYDEALEQLTEAIRLEPLNAEAYHNRAVIYERQGKLDEAVNEYRQALRYNPQYEPSRVALTRLGASASAETQPKSDAERLAMLLADKASQAARRGDYAGAMQQLDEAERVAPDFVMVHQYRSNVAFLMGDRARAMSALKRALELEPDNELFKANLKRLEETTPTPQ